MVFELFRGSGESQVDTIEAQVAEMLDAARETFTLAMSAIRREVEPNEVGKSLRKTDRSINRNERAIRRELVVHAAVRGSQVDVPLLLIYMSISKDIERVGDYTKNLWDLATYGFDLSSAPDRGVIDGYADRISRLIEQTAQVFADRDAETARAVLPTLDELQDEYDEKVVEHLTSEAPSHFGAPRALLYRYFKRITAHLMNVMTAVVMPLDRIDYWDEDKADRG